MKLSSAEIREHINKRIAAHFQGGTISIDILSGDIQKELGIKDSTPQVCGAMCKAAERYPNQVIQRPFKWEGTRLEIRYYKDETAKAADEVIETIVGEPKGTSGGKMNTMGRIKEIPTVDHNFITTMLNNFYDEIIADEYGRYKSWEHCSAIFRKLHAQKDANTVDRLSLNLAFYLASWGMMRGSSFLLQKDYRVHLPAIKIMMEAQYESLWCDDNVSGELILGCGERIAESYRIQANCRNPSPTLLTKVLLGVFGCVPAYDRYFIGGLKEYGLTQKYGINSLNEIFKFYEKHKAAFEATKSKIKQNGGKYTSMKLLDMFFWEVGRIAEKKTREEALADDGE